MLIFSVSFQFYQMSLKRPHSWGLCKSLEEWMMDDWCGAEWMSQDKGLVFFLSATNRELNNIMVTENSILFWQRTQSSPNTLLHACNQNVKHSGEISLSLLEGTLHTWISLLERKELGMVILHLALLWWMMKFRLAVNYLLAVSLES